MKEKTIRLRCSEEFFDSVFSCAKGCGLTTSEFTRNALEEKMGIGVATAHSGFDSMSDDPRRVKFAVRKPIKSVAEVSRDFKAGESVDQFGFKRSLAKPSSKKKGEK